MSDLSNLVAVKFGTEQHSLAELLGCLKVAEKLDFIDEGIADLLIQRAAKSGAVTVSDEELQVAVDSFRRQHRLLLAEATQRWLAEKHWTADNLEQHLERKLIREKLISSIASDVKIERHFARHRRAYDRAVLAHIVVPNVEIAQQLLKQIREEGTDFSALAKQHSVDKTTKHYGGELGVAERSRLSPAVETAVFSADDGDVVGPVKTDMGQHLIKVHHLLLGKLDKNVAAAIRDDLFTEWLDEQRESANIEVPLYDAI